MGESHDTFPTWATPKLNTLCVDGGKVSSLGRPLYKRLGPMLSINHWFWLVLLLVPKHTHALATVHHKLITGIRLTQPRTEMLPLSVGFYLRLHIFFFDTSLPAKMFNVRKLIDSNGVFSIEWYTTQLLTSSKGLFGSLVLNKGVPEPSSSIWHPLA